MVALERRKNAQIFPVLRANHQRFVAGEVAAAMVEAAPARKNVECTSISTSEAATGLPPQFSGLCGAEEQNWNIPGGHAICG
jgi:hypothetical protein